MQLRLTRRLLITKSIVLSTRALQKQKQNLEFGSFGKEINRQSRIKVQTYINKCLVTDKGTFYCVRAIKEIPKVVNYEK